MTGHRATPAHERASRAAAAACPAGELRDQLGRIRLAWEAALLRTDAALTACDAAATRAALDDHQLVLVDLEQVLRRTLAAAVAARCEASEAGPLGQVT